MDTMDILMPTMDSIMVRGLLMLRPLLMLDITTDTMDMATTDSTMDTMDILMPIMDTMDMAIMDTMESTMDILMPTMDIMARGLLMLSLLLMLDISMDTMDMATMDTMDSAMDILMPTMDMDMDIIINLFYNVKI